MRRIKYLVLALFVTLGAVFMYLFVSFTSLKRQYSNEEVSLSVCVEFNNFLTSDKKDISVKEFENYFEKANLDTYQKYSVTNLNLNFIQDTDSIVLYSSGLDLDDDGGKYFKSVDEFSFWEFILGSKYDVYYGTYAIQGNRSKDETWVEDTLKDFEEFLKKDSLSSD